MKEWIEQHRITEIECLVPDLAGAARGRWSLVRLRFSALRFVCVTSLARRVTHFATRIE